MFAAVNYAEAGLWAFIGAGFLVRAIVHRRGRATSIVAALALLAFGFSDVVEVRTGAWWRPWWLLAWKGGCVLVLVALLRSHVTSRRAGGDAS